MVTRLSCLVLATLALGLVACPCGGGRDLLLYEGFDALCEGAPCAWELDGEVASVALGAPRPVTGCPRNMSSDHMLARPFVGDVALGGFTVVGGLLVPACGSDPALMLTRDGDTAGPCFGDLCLQFDPVP